MRSISEWRALLYLQCGIGILRSTALTLLPVEHVTHSYSLSAGSFNVFGQVMVTSQKGFATSASQVEQSACGPYDPYESTWPSGHLQPALCLQVIHSPNEQLRNGGLAPMETCKACDMNSYMNQYTWNE